MWLGDDSKRRNRYDCNNCIESSGEDRHCFLYNKECSIYIPVFEDANITNNSVTVRVENGCPVYELYTVTLDEFLEKLSDIQGNWFEDDHIFSLLVAWFSRSTIRNYKDKSQQIQLKEVCLRGIVNEDQDIVFLSTLEEWASQYHLLPFDGGIMDQPNIVFESFNVIMSTRAQYLSKQHDKMKEEMKPKGGKK